MSDIMQFCILGFVFALFALWCMSMSKSYSERKAKVKDDNK